MSPVYDAESGVVPMIRWAWTTWSQSTGTDRSSTLPSGLLDTPTHLYLYRHFAGEGARSIVHTHSQYATIWAQSCLPFPATGRPTTTSTARCRAPARWHEEIRERYEENTGKVIVEGLRTRT